jgi:hypothetical protein
MLLYFYYRRSLYTAVKVETFPEYKIQYAVGCFHGLSEHAVLMRSKNENAFITDNTNLSIISY